LSIRFRQFMLLLPGLASPSLVVFVMAIVCT
jgi:hypothetical protein